MPKKIDLTNKNFGEWLVLREATKEEKEYRPGSYWLCKCSCGKEKIINGQCLRNGSSKSCGCQTKNLLSEKHKNKNVIDITGKKFGKLIVLSRDLEKEKLYSSCNTYWKCKCDCGNEISVAKSSLTSGRTQSCGCLRKQIAANHLSNIGKNNFIDETGNRYGKLTVLYKIENNQLNREGAIWHCKCECGNEKDIFGIDLRNGTVSSCGCLGKSKGEYIIEKILNEKNIVFNKEYPLILQDKVLRFDFAIYENNQLQYLIEFDGLQHFKAINYFGGENYFIHLQQNDKIKNQWCKENNIPLIRIPYTHLDKLCIKDLQLETSQFLIS